MNKVKIQNLQNCTSCTFCTTYIYCALQKFVNNSLSLAIDFKPGILCSLKAVHLFQNVSELFIYLYITKFQTAIGYKIIGCRISHHTT